MRDDRGARAVRSVTDDPGGGRVKSAVMIRDALQPLQSLLREAAPDDLAWRERAIQACWECVQRIDHFQRAQERHDRDTDAFLCALRHSLEWVLAEQATTDEISRVVTRASRVLDGAMLQAQRSAMMSPVGRLGHN